MRWLGLLLLVPFTLTMALAFKTVDGCIKCGGAMRLLGILAALLLGSLCVVGGYWLAFEGWTESRESTLYQVAYPVAGWIGMLLGAFTAIVGSWRAVAVTGQQVEMEELMEERPELREMVEKLRKEMVEKLRKERERENST